jgi:predicted HicB family RNase H-like nuclease
LAKVAVQCSAETFVVKIATFAKPETVLGINDLVAFDGDSLTDLKKSFQEAVEAYLETCGKTTGEILQRGFQRSD